jgi:hypothetical protein
VLTEAIVTPTKVKVSIVESITFPGPNKRYSMALKDFFELNLPPFPIQRGIEIRARELVKKLAESGPLPKHNEVDILVYTGNDTTSQLKLRKDKAHMLNGHTREYIWKKYSNGETVGGVDFLQIPEKVIVNEYEVADIVIAERLYYSIDSVDAVETKPHKIQGACRHENILNDFKNKPMQQGKIAVPLNMACPTQGSGSWSVPEQEELEAVKDIFGQVKLMKETLKNVDTLGLPGQGVCRYSYVLGVIMLFDQYIKRVLGGDKTQQTTLNKGLERLKQFNPSTSNLEDQEIKDDGIYHIMSASQQNPYGEAEDKAFPYSRGNYTGRNKMMNYVTYCLFNFINGDKISAKPDTSILTSNAYQVFLRSTWTDKEILSIDELLEKNNKDK